MQTDFNSPRNWTEDSEHENGSYQCKCCECGEFFIGHKRRVICKVCVTNKEDNIDIDLMSKMDKNLYIQRMKESIERSKFVDQNIKDLFNSMPEEKQIILWAMLEVMSQD